MASVELRPMTLGEVLDRTFTLYREHFLLFAGIMALPYLVILLFNFTVLLLQRGGGAAAHLQTPGHSKACSGAFGGVILLVMMMGVSHAATVSAVSDLQLGRSTSVREAYGQAKGSILIVIGIMILSSPGRRSTSGSFF